MKQFKSSKIATVCYIIAAIIALYLCFVLASTVVTIRQYYAAYNMGPGVGETISYLFQTGLTPLVSTITVFMAGYILEAVRRLDPANWLTEEEFEDQADARRIAREAKQIAKGEAAVKAAAAAKAAEEEDEDAEPYIPESQRVGTVFEAEVRPEETETEEIDALEAIEEGDAVEEDWK